ncbi:hypothetical protein JQC67_09560 [Aurantibacter crassamenti]|uniref:Uncharacterized protein n=2 Tax=Bacteroidota TaxID=976 RepID=A0AA37SP36_9BACT|nr:MULTISPECIES: hypothetical protein [Bacteroidota]AKP52867.1 hypothetical protein CA2015_3481 [Cyclobacterium amurskyense]MBM1106382.1 hypothetical protein [Aurantibacter crassamenti]GLR18226.1 hypothetical protein GCM10007940_28410 [Portibacter lacus]|tara:strand:- start:2008 stop:2436 length:429 start_codon:yes stop_codon:yes gene_type:complete
MKNKNFKTGWLVENKLAALTHFHSNISLEDIQGVLQETTQMISNLKEPFNIIIDNRLAPIDRIFSLREFQSSSSLLNHSLLNYLIVIKPLHLTLNERQKELEISNGVKLINTDSVKSAIKIVKGVEKDIQSEKIDLTFFPDF